MNHYKDIHNAICAQIESAESAILHLERYDLHDGKAITGLLLDLHRLERYYREVLH
jgi:hypothetical protein